ncbi:MAG: hypothetical protein E6I50_00135 [Chloroflexi bacterium]|nr:MAG: hypothetical protein E6I50_00135 [Chloroflexota bacterium]
MPQPKGIDQHGRASSVVTANEQALLLLEVGVLPGQESGERRRVEDALALETVGAAGASGEKAVEHSEGAGLELAEDGSCGGFDPLRAKGEVIGRGRRQRQIHRHVERFVLAGRKPSLKVLGVGERGGQSRIGRASFHFDHARGAHADELPLEVVDDPGGRQRGGVPRERHVKSWRQQAKEPPWLKLGAREAVDAPGAAEPADVEESRRQLLAKRGVHRA